MNALGPRCKRTGSSLRTICGIATVLVATSVEHRADAAEDGAYGRLDGDLTVELALGVAEAFPGETLAVRTGAQYLHTAGVFGQYEDSLGVGGQAIARRVAFGVDLRPLFLPRFSSNLERGPAHVDLLLDSLSWDLGVYSAELGDGACAPSPSECWFWGLQLGMGLELPLLGRIDGPFAALRGTLRWPTTQPEQLDGAPPGFGGAITLSLGYRLLFGAHLVDAGDALP